MSSPDFNIDSEWISNLLGIGYTMVIFLLGVPIVFLQTYVPEELRKFDTEFQSNQLKIIKKSSILLLPIIFFFGNQQVVFFFDLLFFSNNSNIFHIVCLKFDRKAFFISYFFISFFFFFFFSIKIITYFKKAVFRVDDIKMRILESIFKNAEEKMHNNQKKEISEQIYILVEVSTIFTSIHDRDNYLNKLFMLIIGVISNNYSGEETKLIFEDILHEIFIKDFNNCSLKNINNVIQICDEISKKYESGNNLKSYDSEFIAKNFLTQLCLKLVENNNINLISKCISTLRRFNISQEGFFKIYFYAFEKKMYFFLTTEIGYLIKKIVITVSVKEINEDIINSRNNLIAYFGLLYCENEVSKQFVKNKLNELKKNEIELLKEDFLIAEIHFVKNSKFDTANKIKTMYKTLFRKTKVNNEVSNY